jgi:hypothetical protein
VWSRHFSLRGDMILPTREMVTQIESARWSPDPETSATLEFIVVSLTVPDDTGTSELQRIYQRCAYEAERDEAVGQLGFRLAAARRRHVYVWFMADCPTDGFATFHLVLSDRPITREDVRRKAKRRFSLNLLKDRSEWVGYEKPPAGEGEGFDG